MLYENSINKVGRSFAKTDLRMRKPRHPKCSGKAVDNGNSFYLCYKKDLQIYLTESLHKK